MMFGELRKLKLALSDVPKTKSPRTAMFVTFTSSVSRGMVTWTPAGMVIEHLPYGMMPSDQVDSLLNAPDFTAVNWPSVVGSPPKPEGTTQTIRCIECHFCVHMQLVYSLFDPTSTKLKGTKTDWMPNSRLLMVKGTSGIVFTFCSAAMRRVLALPRQLRLVHIAR